ncbi:hypothetical protein E4U43_004529 [Claviceps pusilla]|uniref:Cell wall glycosyl hydrolase YteR n=1 Tax=Claviceps pusilla TaxID=123648 RepID=A0A9P7N409_9HYPO|nr:hypothetical protein E4U43_004529 [Claviceps pusilla]
MHFFAAASAAAACLFGTAAAGVICDEESCVRSGSANSLRMLDSIVARQQGLIDSGAASSTLESGILGQALGAVIRRYPDTKSRYAPFMMQVLDFASTHGVLTNAEQSSHRPLDRFSLATAIQFATDLNLTVTPRAAEAQTAINASLPMQKRNPDGGLWYYVYPEWSYLDGIFSLLPFMAAQPNPDYDDMIKQIKLLREHCTDKNSSLLVHGYDWSRKAVWADKDTGASPFVWGRSLGWFLSGMVQTWDRLSCEEGKDTTDDSEVTPLCNLIEETVNAVAKNLLNYADPATGAWWQIVTRPGQPGNYLESSSTALFVFSFLKAIRTGLLPRGEGDEPKFHRAALKAYKYTKEHFVTPIPDSKNMGFDKTVSVCSLNSTATYEYYTTRPLVPNSLLGESAFVLAALEVERLRR